MPYEGMLRERVPLGSVLLPSVKGRKSVPFGGFRRAAKVNVLFEGEGG